MPFFLVRANACRQRSTTVNERPKGGAEKRGGSAALYAHVSFASGSRHVLHERFSQKINKTQRRAVPDHGLMRIYIIWVASITGRFSHFFFPLTVILFFFFFFLPLSFSFSQNLELANVCARDKICCRFDKRVELLRLQKGNRMSSPFHATWHIEIYIKRKLSEIMR